MALLVFIWDFGTVLTVWHYLFLYRTLELFRQCGMIGFSMGLWNSTDIVPLFGFLLDFGTVLTVGHYWFFIFLLDFGTVRQCGISCFYIGL